MTNKNPVDQFMTYPCRRFIDPLDPDPELFEIEDIAHSLGMQCRYTGHVPLFYSIAEHCVLMADYIRKHEKSRDLAYAALMHDASEYVLADLMRPVKRRFAEYRSAEERLDGVIRRKFNVSWSLDISQAIAQYDFRMLRTEMSHFYGEQQVLRSFPHIAQAQRLEIEIQHWTPEVARRRFMEAFVRYGI